MASLASSLFASAILGLAAPSLFAASPIAPFQGEGDLGNDTFQPFHADAELSFQTGARLLGEARIAEDSSQLERSFELMREAIARAEVGDGIRVAEDSQIVESSSAPMSSRLIVGIEERVWLTLHSLTLPERKIWEQRFGDLSAASFAKGNMRACERNFPGTSSAVRAALQLADESLEIGRPEDAQTWCERALRHLDFVQDWTQSEAALKAIWARQRVAEQATPANRTNAAATLALPAAWQSLLSLPAPIAIPFENQYLEEDPFLSGLSGVTRPRSSERGPGLGIRPGLAALNAEHIAVQTPSAVHLVDLASLRRLAVFDPNELIDEVFGRVGRPRAARKGGAPGWPHMPLAVPGELTNGDALVLVAGRHTNNSGPNAILCVDIPQDATRGDIGSSQLDLEESQAAPVQTRWILSGNRLWSNGKLRSSDILDDLAECEFQPGTVTVGDRLFVSVRTLDGEVRSWLLALDLATGTPLWKRLLAKGSDLDGNTGRFSLGALPIGAAQPLIASGGMLFVGTHLGVGALLDATDGRLLWSYKNKRRKYTEPGWGGAAPIALPPSMASDGATSLLWAPADSDFLYTLRADSLRADNFRESGPVLGKPSQVGESTDLIGANGDLILTYSRAGANRTLAELRPAVGRRIDSIYLRQNEAFVGRALSSKSHVLASSNRGLFLFDRRTDLRLLDFTPLPTRKSDPYAGGAAYTIGDRVVILGPGTLWVLIPE